MTTPALGAAISVDRNPPSASAGDTSTPHDPAAVGASLGRVDPQADAARHASRIATPDLVRLGVVTVEASGRVERQ
jgi:hypothetical protein